MQPPPPYENLAYPPPKGKLYPHFLAYLQQDSRIQVQRSKDMSKKAYAKIAEMEKNIKLVKENKLKRDLNVLSNQVNEKILESKANRSKVYSKFAGMEKNKLKRDLNVLSNQAHKKIRQSKANRGMAYDKMNLLENQIAMKKIKDKLPSADQIINPQTGRKIKIGGHVWLTLTKAGILKPKVEIKKKLSSDTWRPTSSPLVESYRSPLSREFLGYLKS